jgi:hypothetical protein
VEPTTLSWDAEYTETVGRAAMVASLRGGTQ